MSMVPVNPGTAPTNTPSVVPRSTRKSPVGVNSCSIAACTPDAYCAFREAIEPTGGRSETSFASVRFNSEMAALRNFFSRER